MRIIRLPSGACALGLAALVAGGRLPAQSAPPPQPAAAVPPELVNALFAGMGTAGSMARYYVGVVPPGWPAALIPPAPIAVLGGMQSGTRLVAAFTDSSARRPLDVVNRQLESAGWTRPPREPMQGFMASGFSDDDGRYAFWCSDSSRVTATSIRAPDATSYVRVALDRLPPGTCAPAPRPQRETYSTLPIPPLTPPKGIRSAGGNAGSGGTSTYASTRLADSTMSASTLLTHYVGQLVKAGWKAYPPASTSDFAAQVLEARDKEGMYWRGMLLVVPTASAREISIMMSRPSVQ